MIEIWRLISDFARVFRPRNSAFDRLFYRCEGGRIVTRADRRFVCSMGDLSQPNTRLPNKPVLLTAPHFTPRIRTWLTVAAQRQAVGQPRREWIEKIETRSRREWGAFALLRTLDDV